MKKERAIPMKKLIVCVFLLSLLACASALGEVDPEPGTKLRVVNCDEYITLREAPDTSAAALARLPLGAEAIALGDESNGFVRVAWRGQPGWALESYLTTVKEKGGAVELTDAQRYNLNLFLSNFTEQGFCRIEGGYSYDWADPAQLIRFAIDHCWFNRQSKLEWGDYFNGNNVRLPEDQVAPIVTKYFGLTVKASHEPPYIDYRNGYYYWEETGGHTSDGFASLSRVEKLDDYRYRVWFYIYGGGETWSNEVCYYTPEQAKNAYPVYGAELEGCAVVYTGQGGLDDRSDWALTRYAVNYDIW